MQRAEAAFAASGVRLMAIGFAPPDALARVAEHVGWKGPFLSDESLSLYRRLGIGRGTRRHIYNWGTLRTYARLKRGGAHIDKPVDDPLQLGADALFEDGRVRWVIRPPSPDARPTVGDLLVLLG